MSRGFSLPELHTGSTCVVHPLCLASKSCFPFCLPLIIQGSHHHFQGLEDVKKEDTTSMQILQPLHRGDSNKVWVTFWDCHALLLHVNFQTFVQLIFSWISLLIFTSLPVIDPGFVTSAGTCLLMQCSSRITGEGGHMEVHCLFSEKMLIEDHSESHSQFLSVLPLASF